MHILKHNSVKLLAKQSPRGNYIILHTHTHTINIYKKNKDNSVFTIIIFCTWVRNSKK